jgi:hypothetical protein
MFAKYGRFVESIASRIAARLPPEQRATFDQRLKAAYSSYYGSLKPTMPCR